MANDYTHIEKALLRYNEPYRKTVSGIVPHYNSPQFLRRCLYGLINQSYPSNLVECIVSDDGSPTRTLLGLSDEFSSLLSLQIVSHERVGYRLAKVRNNGISAASADVAIILDCDMIPPSGFLEAHLRWFHVADHIATIGPRKFIDATAIAPEAVPSLQQTLYLYPDIPSISNRNMSIDKRYTEFSHFKNHPHPYNCFYGCNVAFPLASVQSIGPFDEYFNGHCGYEDIEFGYRLHRSGHYLIFEPASMAFHQENQLVTEVQRTSSKLVNLPKLYSKIPDLRNYRQMRGLD